MDKMHLDCMMGAPERVFHRCSTVLLNDEELPTDGDIVLERMFNESLIQMGSLGETVLGKIFQMESVSHKRVVTGRKKSKPVRSGRLNFIHRAGPVITLITFFDRLTDRSFYLKESKKISKNVLTYISK